MSLTPSGIKTDAEYARDVEPWLLNSIDKLANSSPAEFVLKHAAFDIIPLNAFKADKNLYNRYIELKGNADEYSKFVDLVINGLVTKELVLWRENRARVSITKKGIEKCKEPDGPGSWNRKYYQPEDRDPKTPNLR